jgi:hypothetical protein
MMLMRAAVLGFFASALLSAQSLSGTVQDASGAGLPEASVVVRNVETGSERRLSTDASGRYAAPALSIGAYQVTAAKSGFATQVRTGIRLAVGETDNLDVTLPIDALKEVMTVEEAPSPVVLSTEPSTGLVNERQIKDLPLNGRSFDQLMSLNAAVVNYTGERSGATGTSNSSVGNMFAVSGRRPQENLFLLNGIEYTGASLINNTPGGTSGQLLGVEAVREFNVVTDTYGAEYGKRPGGQVSIATASGTNQFHGAVYDFLRNSALDARNFFDQGAIPQFQRNEFGAATGGPIQRDKTFVFANYEGYRQNLGLSDLTLVPDNASRAQALPSVVPLLSLWPVQNGPSLGGGIAEAFSHPLQRIREDFGTVRVDHNLTSKDTLFFFDTVDDSTANTPSANPLSTVYETLREQVASIQEQHVFSPSLLNTARAGFSRASYYFTGQTPVNLPGWVAGAPIGAVVIGGGTALNGASSISGAGTNAGSNLSAVRNLFTFDDRVSLTRGRHQIEAGFWLQRLQANDNLAQNQYGQASFGSLAAFLQGTVSTFTVVTAPTPLSWRSTEAAGFVQDVLSLRRNLQLRVGFRFESTDGWNEAHGRGANYQFDGGVIQTNPTIGSSVFSVNRARFLPEPRIGLAWDPSGDGKTVIHAGFGIYRALLDNLDYRLDQTAPFNTTSTLKNVSVSSLNFAPGAAVNSGSKTVPSGVQPDAFTPTVLTWSFRIEHELTSTTAIAAAYTASHGYHELLSVDANEPWPTYVNGAPYYPIGAALANPNLANTTTWLSEGLSSYNALSLDVRRRFVRGLQFRGVYTFSKSLDDGTAWNSSVAANASGFVMFPLNPKLDWGPSTSDVRHLASVNVTYELPFGAHLHGWSEKAARGWTVSAIESVQSGFPFTPQLGYNPSNNGDSRNPVRPSWNPAFTGPVILGGPNQYFNPAAFLPPAAGTYGNVGRDGLTGPGLSELDLSVAKITSLTEKTRLQFRAEFFNILNKANFASPNAVVFTSATPTPSPTAGVITATSTTSRQIQFGLKLLR